MPNPDPIERALALLVLGALFMLAAWFDLTALRQAAPAGLLPLGRTGAAIVLGWILGWYLTCRFDPTHRVLVNLLLTLAGYVVAAITAGATFVGLALFDLLFHAPDRANHLAVTAMTFASLSEPRPS